MTLDRLAILATLSAPLPRTVVPCPEWGGDVIVRTLTAAERDAWETDYAAHRKSDVRARLVAAAACDEAGARIFTPEDVTTLSALSGVPMARLFDAAITLNKVTADDVAELEKNS